MHVADVQDQDPDAQRNSEEDIGASHDHQSEVTVGTEVGVAGEDFLELAAALVKCDDSAD